MKKSTAIILIIDFILFGWIWQNREKLKDITEFEKIEENVEQTEDVGVSEVMIGETKVLEVKEEQERVMVPTIIPKKRATPIPTIDTEPWGVAKQIDEVTWTMKVGQDEKMATPQEILTALNAYRQRYGSQILNWDKKLGEYSQSRAKYLNSMKNVDKHEGFNSYLQNENGFDKLGFTMLGENISYGYKLNGVHVIEWMYAGDKPHNDNQLDNRWNYVGIGVDGLATCLIFGTGKM